MYDVNEMIVNALSSDWLPTRRTFEKWCFLVAEVLPREETVAAGFVARVY